MSQFQPHPAPGATAKAFVFWTCACLLGFAQRQPSPINQAWEGGRGWGGIDRRGGGGVLQSCQDKSLTRSVSSRTLLSFSQMLGMPCLVAGGLRGQCHTLTECSPLLRSELKRKTHVHRTKAPLPNIKYCFLIPSVAKCAVKMFRRPFNYFHFKNVFMSPILFPRLAKVL